MSEFILLNSDASSDSEADRDMLRYDLRQRVGESNIKFNPQRLGGEMKRFGFDYRYEWVIERDDDAFLLTEHRYIVKKWYHYLLLSMVGVFFGSTVSLMNYLVSPNPTSWIASEPSFLIFGIEAGALITVPFAACLVILSFLPWVGPRPVYEMSDWSLFRSPWRRPAFVLMLVTLICIFGAIVSGVLFVVLILVSYSIALPVLYSKPNLLLTYDAFFDSSTEEHARQLGAERPNISLFSI